MFVACKGKDLQWLGNGPLWALEALYIPVVVPRGGLEPAVGWWHMQKASLGLNLPSYQGDINVRRLACDKIQD